CLIVLRSNLFQIFLWCTKLLRRDIAFRAAHLTTVFLSTAPDSIQLLLLQRRYTLGRFCIEVRLRFCFAVTFDKLASFFVQGSVTTACQNEQLVHGFLAFEVHDLRVLHTEQEATSVQRVCVKLRELLTNLLFYRYILLDA